MGYQLWKMFLNFGRFLDKGIAHPPFFPSSNLERIRIWSPGVNKNLGVEYDGDRSK